MSHHNSSNQNSEQKLQNNSKRYNLTGIGNSLLDLFVDVSEEDLINLNLKKGSADLVSPEEQIKILDKIKGNIFKKVSGGSVANSVYAFSQLGGKASFLGQVAADEFGRFYKKEFEDNKVEFPIMPQELNKQNNITGTALVLLTPDGDRTMRTSLCISSELNINDNYKNYIKDSEWILIEGYILGNGEKGVNTVKKCIEYAKENNTKIAFHFLQYLLLNTFLEKLLK